MNNDQLVRDYFPEDVWDIIFDAMSEHYETCDDEERQEQIDAAREALYDLFKKTEAK